MLPFLLGFLCGLVLIFLLACRELVLACRNSIQGNGSSLTQSASGSVDASEKI